MNLSEKYPELMLPVRVIQLTRGKFTIVDPEDYASLSGFSWYAAIHKNVVYAVRAVWNGVKQDTLAMHTSITGYLMVDHVNWNGLDNRRVNLRPANDHTNHANTNLSVRNTSGLKGVSWHVRKYKWIAAIKADWHNIHLGYFDELSDAGYAYDHAAIENFGEYACTNQDLGLLPPCTCQICTRRVSRDTGIPR